MWRRRPDFRPLALVREMPGAATTQEAASPRSATQKPVVVSQHTEILHSAQSLAPSAGSWYKECARWFVKTIRARCGGDNTAGEPQNTTASLKCLHPIIGDDQPERSSAAER
jgi:hypothetical protein